MEGPRVLLGLLVAKDFDDAMLDEEYPRWVGPCELLRPCELQVACSTLAFRYAFGL